MIVDDFVFGILVRMAAIAVDIAGLAWILRHLVRAEGGYRSRLYFSIGCLIVAIIAMSISLGEHLEKHQLQAGTAKEEAYHGQ